jgi:hypothetical protein
MENEIVPVREIVEVEVKRREPQPEKIATAEAWVKMQEYQQNVVLNVMQAMAKPRR